MEEADVTSIRHTLLTGAAIGSVGLAPACGGSDESAGSADRHNQGFTLAQSELERDAAPDVSAEDQAELAAGNAAFAFDLYAQLAPNGGNLFFSPYSISAALAMTYAGARGETATEMAEVLHFTLPQERLHPAYNHLDLVLQSRAQAEPPAHLPDAVPPRLEIANSIWGQQDYVFESEFLDTLAVNYGAGLRLLDFGSDPEGARQTINRWVSDQTEDKIPELLAPGTITPIIRLVLTNAIYFLANWSSPFEPEATQPGSFFVDPTTEVTVDMMHQADYFNYATGDGYAAIDLPYIGNDLSMLLLVPEAERFAEVEAQLSAGMLNTVVDSLESRNVELAMPKWQFESGFSLAATLQALGMPSAFSGAADFSGMTSVEDLFISDVIHQAFIAVDEAGTEAAAATAVMMAGSALPPEPVSLTVDRPFVFVIRDAPTGAVLFMGRVTDPS
jgi:serpin B